MPTVRTKIGEGGRLVVPAEHRRELGLKPGDDVNVSVRDGELRVVPKAEAIRRLQALVRGHVPEGYSVVDEFLAEKRAEAERE